MIKFRNKDDYIIKNIFFLLRFKFEKNLRKSFRLNLQIKK